MTDTNPGIAFILLQRKVKDLETVIEAKNVIIRQLQTEIDALHEGINLKGWRCGSCHCFNGEEKGVLLSCRHCANPKRTAAELLDDSIANANDAAKALGERIADDD